MRQSTGSRSGVGGICHTMEVRPDNKERVGASLKRPTPTRRVSATTTSRYVGPETESSAVSRNARAVSSTTIAVVAMLKLAVNSADPYRLSDDFLRCVARLHDAPYSVAAAGMCLYNYFNVKERRAWPSMATIAEWTGYSHQTCRKAIDWLVDVGAVIKQRTRLGNVYLLNEERIAELLEATNPVRRPTR